MPDAHSPVPEPTAGPPADPVSGAVVSSTVGPDTSSSLRVCSEKVHAEIAETCERKKLMNNYSLQKYIRCIIFLLCILYIYDIDYMYIYIYIYIER